MVSTFKSKPQTKKAWNVMWLGLTTFFIGPLIGFILSFMRKILDPVSFNPAKMLSPGALGVFLSMAMSITTIIMFFRNYQTGERSWALWLGFVPAVLIALFWIFMIVGELLFPH